MPTIYYAPIIHSIEDCGSLGPAIKGAFTKKYGGVTFDELQKETHGYWQTAEKRIKEVISDVRGIVIYHDSFPVGDRVKVLALFRYMCRDHPESPNFRLVKKLLEEGAVLEGTEDMNLVKEQLEIYRYAIKSSSHEKQAEIFAKEDTRSKKILELRDIFIAERIRDTLPESGRGILFIGRDHDVISKLEKLPEKFTIIYL